MPLADLLERAREVVGHHDEPAFALDGLEHDARDALRVDLAGEEELEARDRLVGADAAVRVRARRAVDLGRERPEPALVCDLRRHRHRQERPAVERVVEDDHGGPAGRGPRDLDGVLDRLRARVEENRALLLPRARGELGEPAADLDVRLVHPDHEALVQVAVDLLMDRGDRRRQPMAGVLATEPAGEVDVLATVDVPDPRALGPVDDERRCRDPARHVSLTRCDHALAGPHLLQRHGPIHPTNGPPGQEPAGRNPDLAFRRPVEASGSRLAWSGLAIVVGAA